MPRPGRRGGVTPSSANSSVPLSPKHIYLFSTMIYPYWKMGAFGPNRQKKSAHATREKRNEKCDQKSPNVNRQNQTDPSRQYKIRPETNKESIQHTHNRDGAKTRKCLPIKSAASTPNQKKRTAKTKEPTPKEQQTRKTKNGSHITKNERRCSKWEIGTEQWTLPA